MEFMPSCEATCPVVCNTRKVLRESVLQGGMVEHFEETHMEDTVDRAITEYVRRHGSEPENVAASVGYFRRQLGRVRERAHMLVGRGDAFLGRLALGCTDGPLTMRATRGDTTYTVTVCTSTGLPKELLPDQLYEPVTIERTHHIPED